jgi:hypothetical protein
MKYLLTGLMWRVRTDYRVSSQLHFARPMVYDEIYTFKNKWDKDHGVYRAFDMDESSLTQTDYLKAKHRRTLYANKFSRKATIEVQHLVREQVRFSVHIRITHPSCLMGFVVGSIL